jgi:GNAT superfamily N-acetyltransferase
MLRRDVDVLLDRKRHPFHEHGEVEYFLAVRGRRCVGRIAAIENHAHNAFHGERVGFFGFLDAESDPEVFRALLSATEGWASARGLSAIRGPASFSTNEECGLLVKGFETPPSIMTPWTPASWVPLVEKAGYRKAMDLLSYWVTEDSYSERMHRIAEKMIEKLEKQHGKVVCRPLRMERFEEELDVFRQVYNAAWEKNWGFVPLTPAEITFMAKELKMVIVPELVRFMEIDGVPVGVAFSLPDYNQILRYLRGSLSVSGVAMALLMKSRLKSIRFIALGVAEGFRNRGIETILVADAVKSCREKGYCAADMGWILETNQLMNRTLQAIGGTVYKVHRMYEKSLLPGS